MSTGSNAPVVVGTNLALSSDVAIHAAARWAAREGTSVVVAHVDSLDALPYRARVTGTNLPMDRVEDLTEHLGVPAEFVVLQGSPPYELARLVEERAALLVVVGTSTKSTEQRAILGSTTEFVVRHARCPVLVARGDSEDGCVIAGTDFSDEARLVITAAAWQARLRGVRLHVVHSIFEPTTALEALEPPALDPATNGERDALDDAAGERVHPFLHSTDAESDADVMVGEPARCLVSTAEAEGASLVVVATHGRAGMRRLLLGSVADFVVRHAPCSVLLVRAAS